MMTSNRELPESLEPAGEFAESIRSFRSAMHHAGHREAAPDAISAWLAPARKRRQAAQRRMAVSMAAGVALLFSGVLPLTLHKNHEETPTSQATVLIQKQVQTKDNASDTALLEQVDSAVTESVPDSLAPLAELDHWSSESQTENRQ